MIKARLLVALSAISLAACESLPTDVQDAFNQIPVPQNLFQGTPLENMLKGTSMASLSQEQQNLPAPSLSLGTANQQEYEAATNYYNETVAQGVVLGGVIAGAGCAFLANTNDTETALCVAGGALLGGLAGNQIAKRNQELIADRESVLAELEQAEKNREAAKRVLKVTNDSIELLKQEIADLEAKKAAGTITEQQYRSDLIEAKKISVQLANGLAKVESDLEQQRKVFVDLESQVETAEDVNVRATKPQVTAEREQTESLIEIEIADATSRIDEIEINV